MRNGTAHALHENGVTSGAKAASIHAASQLRSAKSATVQAIGKVPEHIRQMETGRSRAGADTLRLWDFYREQSNLWRALALLLMPATLIAVFAAVIMFVFADTRIGVQASALPAVVSVNDISDTDFIQFAERLIQLTTTYQSPNAQKQFTQARQYLWEPALHVFDEEVMAKELSLVMTTRRTQMFFPSDRLIKIDRYPDEELVIVRIPGVRLKVIGDQIQPQDEVAYYVKMSTIPRNVLNGLGIVAVDIRAEITNLGALISLDRKEERRKRQEQLRSLAERRAKVH